MKNLKNILLGVLGAVVVLFIVGIFMSDDETSTSESDPTTESANEFYGNNGSSDEGASDQSNNNNADGKVISLNAEQFKKLVADYTSNKSEYIGNGPCVVDFYAQWCGPCKQLAPVLSKMAAKYAGRVTVYKVDIDEAPDVSNAYDIQSIPTLFFCSNGKMEIINGVPSEGELDDKISNL